VYAFIFVLPGGHSARLLSAVCGAVNHDIVSTLCIGPTMTQMCVYAHLNHGMREALVRIYIEARRPHHILALVAMA
jgi:hypothetical protein